MGFFDLFKKKSVVPNVVDNSAKVTNIPQENARCVHCRNNMPEHRINAGSVNENISFQITDNILYLSGIGAFTKEDYLVITAQGPRYETITYNRVLPWAVCPGIRETKYIGEGCPVNNIPKHIKKIVINGEITGVEDFLRNSNDWIGVKLQSVKEYFDL